MERDLIERLQGFKLSSEEKDKVELEEVDVLKSKDECNRSLIGKNFGEKRVNFTGIKNTTSSIWQTKEGFIVREIGTNLFQFVFSSQEDKNKVLNGKTWSFDSQYLILREWKDRILEKISSINYVDLWVQVWNVPVHWISLETGRKIGNEFGKITDILIPETSSVNGRFIKLLVEICLDKPLARGMKIKLGTEVCWRQCVSRKEDIQQNRICEGQFGEWLRAYDSPPGRPTTRGSRNEQGTDKWSVNKEKAIAQVEEKDTVPPIGNKENRAVGKGIIVEEAVKIKPNEEARILRSQ
ncbi:hypothetical protein DH2020_046721 [Rehmannia glutinosa]|uniref:DUF4283 domain-containing protein n=1 Tax=Rehmannia glutinosa TaxID=99300 RepID=A0ABR0UAN2_REHGL